MKRLLIGFIIAVAMAMAGISREYGHGVAERRLKLENTERRVIMLEEERTELEEHHRELAQDPVAVEEAIRRRMHYARPGEQVLAWRDLAER